MDEQEVIRYLLTNSRTVAVVGLSSNPRKDSYIVAHHLHRYGYTVVPINPTAQEILGRKAYPSLTALPPELAAAVDLVVIFRPAGEVPAIVREALEHLPNLRGIWTQKNIVHPGAAELARSRGLAVVQDRCVRTQHLYLRFVAGAVPAKTAADGG
ncbi:MAG: CoA-binding protein [Chloroflexota bacterium]|mgnify:CR=1 FL=1